MKSIKNPRNITGISSLLIKNHPKSQNCPPFVAFIDKNGAHRGSQKIDDSDDINEIEKKVSVNSEIFENARNSINELEHLLKFYHLKVERKGVHGESGFEHKVADEKDKIFMNSSFYKNLIEFLSENKDQSTFGIIDNEGNHECEGGS